jgi:hypothetical protein
MTRALSRAALPACLAGLICLAIWGPPRVESAGTAFAAEIARLSEAPGAFDTDNLISNERAYLEVIPALVAAGVTGGAYIGVGPDQNFSYIARIRPSIAYLIDIRRDNLLLHLLLKALFAHGSSRAEYLCLLTGRAPPGPPAFWADAPVERLVAYVDSVGASASRVRSIRESVEATIAGFGVPLSSEDMATIRRFHDAFIAEGLSLRFNSHGRPPRPSYPTFRELILAGDRTGRRWSYLASEEDFQVVRALQAQDRIVPVIGDVGGSHALRAIAETLTARGERVSAFYISNVETYLPRGGAARRFAENLALLPRDGRSVMIRSIFSGGTSVSRVAPMNETIAVLR